MTDGSASPLSSRYTFFSYVARYLPFHLAEGLQENDQVCLETSKFVRTHHFCALVEYLVATSQNPTQIGFLESMYYWGEIFSATWMQLDQAFNLELNRREREFGPQDERYQSWLGLACLMPETAWKLSEPQISPSNRLARNRSVAIKLKGNAISLLPQHIGRRHLPAIQRVSGSLQAFSQVLTTFRSSVTDLLASSVESMPVPMLLLAGRVARQ